MHYSIFVVFVVNMMAYVAGILHAWIVVLKNILINSSLAIQAILFFMKYIY